MVRKIAAELVGGFPENLIDCGNCGGETALFRTALKRWFKGINCPERLIRYWVKRGGEFNYFLDESKVDGNKLVFTDSVTSEESGDASSKTEQYQQKVKERIAVLTSLKAFNDNFPPRLERIFKAVTEFDELRTNFDALEGRLHPQRGVRTVSLR